MPEKLWIGQPLYGGVSLAHFKMWRTLDQRDVKGFTEVTGAYLGVSMQAMMDTALLNEEWDRIVVVEQDMVLASDTLHRIAREHADYDIVGALYFGHHHPFVAQNCYLEPDGSAYTPVGPDVVKAWLDEPGRHPVDSVPMGCTSISRRCLEEWDPEIPAWHGDLTVPSGISHDVHFSHQARKQGFTLAVDSSILPGHLTTIEITWQHNQESW